MYVLPAGTDFGGALAYADSSYVKTVYNDKAASYITTHVHEIGHNLGMAHSGEENSRYGDATCYMGELLLSFSVVVVDSFPFFISSRMSLIIFCWFSPADLL
jgi:hypothetical protein